MTHKFLKDINKKRHTGISEGAFALPGKWVCLGNQHDNAITPAKGSGYVKAAYSANAPPWEKPPNKTRLAGTPA